MADLPASKKKLKKKLDKFAPKALIQQNLSEKPNAITTAKEGLLFVGEQDGRISVFDVNQK
jgi:hypothetical protein